MPEIRIPILVKKNPGSQSTLRALLLIELLLVRRPAGRFQIDLSIMHACVKIESFWFITSSHRLVDPSNVVLQ